VQKRDKLPDLVIVNTIKLTLTIRNGAEAVTILTSIRKVPGSYPGPDIRKSAIIFVLLVSLSRQIPS
jgi:hypothetical protein